MIEIIINAPIIVKILASLAAIILINKTKANQIVAVLGGTLLLVFWVGHDFHSAAAIAWNRFSNTDNIFLLAVIFVIIFLSSQMKETGMMEDLVEVISARFSKTTSMAVLPAVIGLLPMPGGALFSAPLVDSCDPESKLAAQLKTRINYWFRHIWEYWWPLFPGVLLAIDISGLQVGQYMLFMIPISIFSAVGATFLLLRKAAHLNINTEDPNQLKDDSKKSGIKSFLFSVSPIILIMAIYSSSSLLFPALVDISRYLPIFIGIIISIVYLQIVRPLNPEVWKKIIFSKMAINFALLVALIRIYGAVIEGPLPDGSLLMEGLRTELAAAGISPYILIMLIPLICGISTGIAIGTVGASFPIVFSLIGTDPSLALVASTTVLAYSLGHVGQLLSPVHVCLLVSNEYYDVGLFASLKGLIVPSLVVAAAGIILSQIYLLIL